jgi:hypothetical protein
MSAVDVSHKFFLALDLLHKDSTLRTFAGIVTAHFSAHEFSVRVLIVMTSFECFHWQNNKKRTSNSYISWERTVPHFSFYINVYLPIFNIMAKFKKKFNVGTFLFFRFSVYAVHDRQCFLIKLVLNTIRIISKTSTVTPNLSDIS